MKIWLHSIRTPGLMGVSSHIYTAATSSPGKFPGCPFCRRLGRPHGRSGRCAEERKSLARDGNRTAIPRLPGPAMLVTANQCKTALCLNLRLVRDVIVRFRRVYLLCLKTVLCDVWESMLPSVFLFASLMGRCYYELIDPR
jgi:hypothetical protein